MFRRKFGFQNEHECPRYFVPLTRLGSMMLSSSIPRRPRSVCLSPSSIVSSTSKECVPESGTGEIEGT